MRLSDILATSALVAIADAISTVVTVYPKVSETTNVVYITRTKAAETSSMASLTSSTSKFTEVTSCHYHETVQYCMAGDLEGSIVGAPTASISAPASYTGCHVHATETFCMDSNGDEVQFVSLIDSVVEDGDDVTTSGKNCHFHAGVEHCVGSDGEESQESCEKIHREYNIPLRIGLLFVILATSLVGSLGPMLIRTLFDLSMEGIIFVIIKQFGTGVIISTSFVHLITHASLMWNSDCMGSLGYEAAGEAITMAGLFLAFLFEYLAHRALQWRSSNVNKGTTSAKAEDEGSESDKKVQVHISEDMEKNVNHPGHDLLYPGDKISVLTMEAGIIFHSMLIGITLVVAADSFFITLFIVILFHQVFEGLALGSRIAQLENTTTLAKISMGVVFAFITPIGMAIGIGVLSKFNGNDKSTLIALGTLDSFSAGVLIWTGVVEMWAHDWLFGPLTRAPVLKTCIALISLMAGMILMSVLGKWA
jgi:zinc transporter 1/2/3